MTPESMTYRLCQSSASLLVGLGRFLPQTVISECRSLNPWVAGSEANVALPMIPPFDEIREAGSAGDSRSVEPTTAEEEPVCVGSDCAT